MYFYNMKNPIHKRILITCVKLPRIKVCLTHGKHIGLGELHHHLQKQPFQLTNVHLQSLLLQISCSTTLLLEVKLLIMAKTWKNMPENHFKHFFENFIETAKLKKPSSCEFSFYVSGSKSRWSCDL